MPSPIENILAPLVNHRLIEAFRAVMIRGTATEAAVMLHTSQPVVSKLIARLQTVSGLKLFELRKGRLMPTPEARQLFNVVERSYIGLEQIGQTISELRGMHASRIEIGCLPSIGMGVMPEIARRFMDRHPTVQVAIKTVSSTLVKDSVAAGRLDLGITMRQVDTAGTQAEPLVGVNAVCVMSPAHHLASKKAIHAKDLHGQAFISPDRNDNMRVAIEKVFAAQRVKPIVAAETTYAITICMLALQGVGVGIVSPFVVPPLLKAGLVARPFKPDVPVDLVLLTPLGQPISRAAAALVEVLREDLAGFSLHGLLGEAPTLSTSEIKAAKLVRKS
ncbi:LysR substrate-binding domain-containing protein [Xylophilus sp. GOD-11R]|uniref:LysR substrate-binding domain-containing protein n=1 Tax=Xylophilus sp. GOD-11R TaxID=3089814 RepID=UPI00298C36BA|nr:LysR substrate-binding domain-containing protein [Xylophilus sp. GOD-11R]WPB59111.1 LysR substrate-binding domain-containing protein [Xylophilus sp. GOD-11R]